LSSQESSQNPLRQRLARVAQTKTIQDGDFPNLLAPDENLFQQRLQATAEEKRDRASDLAETADALADIVIDSGTEGASTLFDMFCEAGFNLVDGWDLSGLASLGGDLNSDGGFDFDFDFDGGD